MTGTVVILIGTGSIGVAVARRAAAGHTLLLADRGSFIAGSNFLIDGGVIAAMRGGTL